jgi:alpha-L-fucosidase
MQPLSRRQVLLRSSALALSASTMAAPAISAAASPSQAGAGPFQPNWASLCAGYKAPDWFRDAKFGIWAHWSAQCVPEFGDWYGRLMYVQGDPFYEHHVKTYGHPSRFGFMEIENLWKAENWRPEELMDLYVRAGAKYFVALANHHDNLDTFDSAHHAWNTLRVGPKKDIIGTWEKIARGRGLRFGVSNHSAHAWHWWQTAYGYDAEGPLAGVRYDAYRLTKADGVGKWWEGLDPQELYTGRHMVIPDGVKTIKDANAWHAAHDGAWWETPPTDDPGYARQWLARCNDLVDKYRPDFIYFDDTELPLGQAGLDAVAHFYNSDIARNGSLQAVATGKKLQLAHRGGVVEDFERGFSDVIRPDPWQTCTCIGQWHYDRALFERHGYKTVPTVVRMLCDIVSKNGNLLLSIPLKGDGTIDSDEHAFLTGLAAWMEVNGEAIYGTRPWRVYGEGPTQVQTGMFVEQSAKPYTAEDVRYTTRDGQLYALMMARPEGDVVRLKSLAAGGADAPRVGKVELLGASGPLQFSQTGEGLVVHLPAGERLSEVYALRIGGVGLTA